MICLSRERLACMREGCGHIKIDGLPTRGLLFETLTLQNKKALVPGYVV